MITLDNQELLEFTDFLETQYDKGAVVPLFFEDFLAKSLTSIYEKEKPKFPMEIKIPKSIDRLLERDYEPAKIITIKEPIYYKNRFPVWFADSLKGVRLLGLGYRNGDSRYPSDIKLDDADIHMLMGGSTGQGKSVTMNALIFGLLFMYAPWMLRMVMADAKIVEFKRYALGKRPPHITAVGATTDADYLISMLSDLRNQMDMWNAVFAQAGVQNIIDFRDKTGLAIPQTVIPLDEYQTMFINAKRKEKEIIEILDAFGRLGRSTGFHLVMSSQEVGSVPTGTLANIKVRGALGCDGAVSEKIIGNDEAKINYGFKGRLIINLNPSNKSKKDNISFRVPFQPSKQFEEQKEFLSDLADELGFRYDMAFYDEDSLMDETSFKEFTKEKVTGVNKIYLGEPSYVMRDPDGDNYVRMTFTGEDIENIGIFSPLSKSLERYAKMIKANIMAMGDKVINNVFIADKPLYNRCEFDQLKHNAVEFKDFTLPGFPNYMEAIITRKILLEADDIVFSGAKASPDFEDVFELLVGQDDGNGKLVIPSEFNNDLSKLRAQAIMSLASQKNYMEGLNLEATTAEVIFENKKRLVLRGLNYYKSIGCETVRLTYDRLVPIYNWIIGLDKVIGLGRDSKSANVTKLKKILQDCTAANVRFIIITTNMDDTSDLKSGIRFAIMSGLNQNQANKIGCPDYPESENAILGIFHDKYGDDREARKFKVMRFDGEIMKKG